MKYFYDCEFIEDGYTIELISIGIVAEDGREFYAVSTEFNPDHAGGWVREHVIPKLPSPGSPVWMSRAQIRQGIERFFAQDDHVELWAWIGAYDHVVLCQLWGAMTQLPAIIPRFTHELKQLWEQAHYPNLPRASHAHDALADARDNSDKYQTIISFMGNPSSGSSDRMIKNYQN